MNVELLQQVKAYILAEPRRLDMSVVMAKSNDAPCGSAGCIDGWAQYLTNVEQGKKQPNVIVPYYDPDYSRGREVLDITEREAERLFTPPEWDDCYDDDERVPMYGPSYAESWPIDLIYRYVAAQDGGDQQEMANITAERIDRFIASNGEE